MSKPRLFRVSCFAPGADLSDACRRHFAPRTRERAWEIFLRERQKIRAGVYGFVVLHQGNLMHHSYKIHQRADHWTHADELAMRHTCLF